MLPKILTTATLAAALVSAQTYTSCDPTKKDCPNRKAVGAEVVNVDFRKGANDFFTIFEGTKLTYDDNLGAVFAIKSDTEAPTIGTNRFILFGQVDVTVRAALGVGIVTSFVLQSDDLDEIDWEWLGGDATQVQTNYFSKGCTTVYDRGGFSAVANPQNEFHTYTIKWTPTRLDWIIDGTIVRTLMAANAQGCSGYPQTPMEVKLGTWVAGRKGAAEGTIQWAGGLANFASAPFLGYYQSIKIVDYMGGDGVTGPKNASEYAYTDRSGTWQSIKVIGDDGSSSGGSKDTSKNSSTSTKSSSSTTLSAVSSLSTSLSNSTATGTSTGNTNGAVQTTTGAKASSSASSAPTSGATKITHTLGNIGLLGAALLVGSWLL